MATKKKGKASPKKPSRPASRKNNDEPKIRKDYQSELKDRLKDNSLEIIAMADDHTFAPSEDKLIPSGALALDAAFGFKGWPGGKIFELAGPPHCGKTTISAQATVEAQKLGLDTYLLETEKTSSIPYFTKLGVDTSKLHIVRKTDDSLTLQGCAEFLRSLGRAYRGNPKPTLVVWDSLGATPTDAEMERDIGDKKVGDAAGVLKQTFRILPQLLAEANIALLIINHEYQTFGQVSYKTTYGGSAVKYLSSLRIGLRKVDSIKLPNGDIVGMEGELRVTKNKYGMPERKIRYAIMDGGGIDNVWFIHNELTKRGVIEKSGSWFSFQFGDQTIKYQGSAGLLVKVTETPDLWGGLVNTYISLQNT